MVPQYLLVKARVEKLDKPVNRLGLQNKALGVKGGEAPYQERYPSSRAASYRYPSRTEEGGRTDEFSARSSSRAIIMEYSVGRNPCFTICFTLIMFQPSSRLMRYGGIQAVIVEDILPVNIYETIAQALQPVMRDRKVCFESSYEYFSKVRRMVANGHLWLGKVKPLNQCSLVDWRYRRSKFVQAHFPTYMSRFANLQFSKTIFMNDSE
jgi:hypothetical protein